MPNDDKTLHNQGEIDASNGINRPPHDGLEVAMTHLVGGRSMGKELEAENAAYQSGQDNHHNQKRGWSLFG